MKQMCETTCNLAIQLYFRPIYMFSTLLQGHVSDAMRKKIDNTTIIGVPVLDLDGTMPFNFVSSICEDIIL